MSSQQYFKGIVSLSEEQYITLSTTGTLTVGDITLTYSPTDTVYVTPEVSSTDSNIELLIGTDNEPIDLYNLTAGKYYLLQGYVKQSASNNLLVKMYSDDTGAIPASVLCYRWVDFANNQKITFFNANAVNSEIIYNETMDTIIMVYKSGFNVSNAQIIRRVTSLNGSSGRISVSIYAPTTSGTSGQVLQSNGANQAPTWVTPNYASSTDLEAKLDKNQGSENAGKVLTVGEDGNVTPQDAGGSGGGGTEKYTHYVWYRRIVSTEGGVNLNIAFTITSSISTSFNGTSFVEYINNLLENNEKITILCNGTIQDSTSFEGKTIDGAVYFMVLEKEEVFGMVSKRVKFYHSGETGNPGDYSGYDMSIFENAGLVNSMLDFII